MRTRQRQQSFKVDENRRLTFYAAVFDEPTVVKDFRPGGKERSEYTEVVRPGTFTEALRGQGEVIANVDHDRLRTFARRSDGTLIMQEDPHGLFCSAWIPEDPVGESIITGIGDGTLTGCSFKFQPTKERWAGDTCELLSVELIDVCVTGRPAYPGTDIKLRTRDVLADLLTRLRLVKIRNKILHTRRQ